MFVLQSRVGRVDAVAFSPDGTLTAVGGTNGLELWSVYQNERIWRWEDESDLRQVRQIYFGPDNWLLAVPQPGYDLMLMDLLTQRSYTLPFPYSDDCHHYAAWDAQEYHVAVSSMNRLSCWRFQRSQTAQPNAPSINRIVVWDTPIGIHSAGHMLFCHSPRDDPMARSEIWTLENNIWQVRKADTGEVDRYQRSSSTHAHQLLHLGTAESILARYNEILLVWSLANLRKPVRLSKENKRQFTGLAEHPSGRYFATASNDKAIRLWDVLSWEPIKAFEWKAGRMRSIAFSPDGLVAVAGGEQGEFVLFDVDL